jgi:hypothetical protein
VSPEQKALALRRRFSVLRPRRTRQVREAAVGRTQQLAKANRYGLTLDELQARIAHAGGNCEICRQPFSGSPFIDHDHETGRVRGLLCPHCNSVLGFAKDSVAVLAAAIQYLEARR